jgi:hypothetical protein
VSWFFVFSGLFPVSGHVSGMVSTGGEEKARITIKMAAKDKALLGAGPCL